MKNLLTVFLFAGLLSACGTGGTDATDPNTGIPEAIPALVLQQFNQAYPGATDVEWDVEDDSFEVEFDFNGEEMEINYDREGNVLDLDD